jgi:hypothetical protein
MRKPPQNRVSVRMIPGTKSVLWTVSKMCWAIWMTHVVSAIDTVV